MDGPRNCQRMNSFATFHLTFLVSLSIVRFSIVVFRSAKERCNATFAERKATLIFRPMPHPRPRQWSMRQVRYLIDESVRQSVVAALRRIELAIDVWRVGQSSMPPFGSTDRDILAFCEQQQRELVSLDRASMPIHVGAHMASGGHTSLFQLHSSLRSCCGRSCSAKMWP